MLTPSWGVMGRSRGNSGGLELVLAASGRTQDGPTCSACAPPRLHLRGWLLIFPMAFVPSCCRCAV
eukprot:6156078-Pyramimonas_sp.AAC.1